MRGIWLEGGWAATLSVKQTSHGNLAGRHSVLVLPPPHLTTPLPIDSPHLSSGWGCLSRCGESGQLTTFQKQTLRYASTSFIASVECLAMACSYFHPPPSPAPSRSTVHTCRAGRLRQGDFIGIDFRFENFPAVRFTARILPLLEKIMLCSKLHCQKVLN